MKDFSCSVVIPCYNAASWLPETITKIALALEKAGLNKTNAEIIVVDDGSSDDSRSVAENMSSKVAFPVNVIAQKNQGRYLARRTGVNATKFPYIWFVDARVHVAEDALKFVRQQVEADPDKAIWNAHVYVAKEGNIIARFGDAITYIGWRRYFGNPRTTSYGLEEFDYFPKGTTSFFVRKDILQDAMNWFEANTTDIKNSSDDTLLIRHMATYHRINISPEFACRYHARTKLKQFTKHSFHRGRAFIDGFLRKGNRFYYPLIVFLVLSVLTVAAVIAHPPLLRPLVALAVLAWVGELIVALLLRTPVKDALSLFALTPIFFVCYAAGLWAATIRNKIAPVLRSKWAR